MLGWLQFFRTLQVIFRALPVSNVPKLTIMSLRAVLTFGSVLRYGGYVLLRAWKIISCDTALLLFTSLGCGVDEESELRQTTGWMYRHGIPVGHTADCGDREIGCVGWHHRIHPLMSMLPGCRDETELRLSKWPPAERTPAAKKSLPTGGTMPSPSPHLPRCLLWAVHDAVCRVFVHAECVLIRAQVSQSELLRTPLLPPQQPSHKASLIKVTCHRDRASSLTYRSVLT